jgi:anti-sigma factor RsiW
MDRTTPANHAGHDELLIARLYGGDVNAAERARAANLMADCPECAAVFADLGKIAAATAAIAARPVPSRPRDFTLTAADAARLRPVLGAGTPWSRFSLRRSLGGSLAALGIAGVVMTGALSVIGGAASPMSNQAYSDTRAAAPAAGPVSLGSQGSEFVAAGGASSPAALVPSFQAPAAGGSPEDPPMPVKSAGTASNDGKQAGGAPDASAADLTASGNPQLAAVPHATGGTGGGATSDTSFTAAQTAAQNGLDARLVWLLGFGVLFGVGVAIMLLPAALRRRRGGLHR